MLPHFSFLLAINDVRSWLEDRVRSYLIHTLILFRPCWYCCCLQRRPLFASVFFGYGIRRNSYYLSGWKMRCYSFLDTAMFCSFWWRIPGRIPYCPLGLFHLTEIRPTRLFLPHCSWTYPSACFSGHMTPIDWSVSQKNLTVIIF